MVNHPAPIGSSPYLPLTKVEISPANPTFSE
jgi:hypothetical protein